MQISSSRAVAVMLCISVFVAHAFAGETFSTQFGKREIPVGLIRRALRPHLNDIDNIDLSRAVYEIIDGNQLVGFDTKLHLADDTTLRPPGTSTSLKYTVNGDERFLTPSAKVRHGKGFTVIHRESDDRVVHVFGNGLNLKPVDAVYPDVFVNTLSIDPTRETLMDPVEVVKRAAVRNDLVTTAQNSTILQSGSCARGVTHYFELAIAFDNKFCAMFSDDEAIASAAVQTLVNQADEVFRKFTCLSIALVYLEAHCNDRNDPFAALYDPYAALFDFPRGLAKKNESLYIQEAFGTFWEEFRTYVSRDAAYFLSGFGDGAKTGGAAGLSTACSANGYGWSEKLTLAVFIHEIGHIAGSDHTPDGIMIESMESVFPDDSIFFSQDSINMITSYVDSLPEDCLSASAPLCDNTCPGPCVNGQCIARFSGNSPGIVPCSPVLGNFRCVNLGNALLFHTFSTTADCPANFKYVAREASEANELDVFCCREATDSTRSIVVPEDQLLPPIFVPFEPYVMVFKEFIRNWSVIEARSLLQTELVPSCQLSDGGSRGIVPTISVVRSTSPEPS